MKHTLIIICFAVLALAVNTKSNGQQYTPSDAWADAQISLRADKSSTAQLRTEWWSGARFGMFIHWNPSSIISSEISWSKQFYNDDGEKLLENPRPDAGFSGGGEHREWMDWFTPAVPYNVYDNLYKSFYPGMFNADTVVAQARQAGMKYIVMVAKHHDGFCMWNSSYTDFDVMSTPVKRDILGEMAAAAQKAGLKFGIYYSQRDWHHPDYSPATMAKYNSYMRSQLKELLTNYGEIATLFFDAGEWKTWQLWEGESLFKMIYSLQPGIVVNDRCGVPADYATPEQTLGGFNNKRNWESCMTFTGFWSWHGYQTPVITYEACLRYLIGCAGGDGNLLMNIGPMPTGQIDTREAARLQQIGGWLQKNGQSIYGTRGGPFLPNSATVSTYRGQNIFIHVFKEAGNQVNLPGIKAAILKVETLAGQPLVFKQTVNTIQFELPAAYKSDIVTVIRLTLNRPINENEVPVGRNK
jgi:alpha-L-fucosidase